MAKSRRHHFLAQFYLCNFAEPMFSNKICVYERKTGKWSIRTPKGVGWFPHLYSIFDEEGERTDSFEKFLNDYIETPTAPAMKKAAQAPDSLTRGEKQAIAMFIGLTYARTPAVMQTTLEDYFSKLPVNEVIDIEGLVKIWCHVSNQSYTNQSRSEFLKPSLFFGILVWAASLRDRLLSWNWHFVHTTRDLPFITSDWPVFMQKEKRVHFVSFPISSETALIVWSAGKLRENLNCFQNVIAMNRQTLVRACEFVVCHQNSFPGDELLPKWTQGNI